MLRNIKTNRKENYEPPTLSAQGYKYQMPVVVVDHYDTQVPSIEVSHELKQPLMTVKSDFVCLV